MPGINPKWLAGKTIKTFHVFPDGRGGTAHDPVIADTGHRLKAALAIFLFALTAILWWVGYVRPREEFLLSVSECAGADPSRVAWNRCVETEHE